LKSVQNAAQNGDLEGGEGSMIGENGEGAEDFGVEKV
jgi:hypothetical protein